jgi:hypothetical protein
LHLPLEIIGVHLEQQTILDRLPIGLDKPVCARGNVISVYDLTTTRLF